MLGGWKEQISMLWLAGQCVEYAICPWPLVAFWLPKWDEIHAYFKEIKYEYLCYVWNNYAKSRLGFRKTKKTSKNVNERYYKIVSSEKWKIVSLKENYKCNGKGNMEIGY